MDPLFPEPVQPRNPGIPIPGHGTIHDAVIADVRERAAKGEREYGGKHYPHNGLDGLTEGYEEALDMAFWLRQEIEERKLSAAGESESNEARRDERARILAAARQAVVTFTRPGLGNGPEHGQHVKVVPWAVLEELLGEEKPS
jgi:hypothetical protein